MVARTRHCRVAEVDRRSVLSMCGTTCGAGGPSVVEAAERMPQDVAAPVVIARAYGGG